MKADPQNRAIKTSYESFENIVTSIIARMSKVSREIAQGLSLLHDTYMITQDYDNMIFTRAC